MVKKYKFKLEGLLKLRKLKESTLKVELGLLNKEIARVKSEIEILKSNISQTYLEQEQVLTSSTSGQMAQFYPQFIQSKREDISNKESLLYSLEKKYQKKLMEVNTAMGECKIISNMKDKDFEVFKKQINKKEEDNREELLQMTRFFKGEV